MALLSLRRQFYCASTPYPFLLNARNVRLRHISHFPTANKDGGLRGPAQSPYDQTNLGAADDPTVICKPIRSNACLRVRQGGLESSVT
jgi:hypothetical protein